MGAIRKWRGTGVMLVAAMAGAGAVASSAAASGGPPQVQSATVSFFPVSTTRNGAQIDATVTGATSVSLVLQSATVANRKYACDPSHWKFDAELPAVRFHKIAAKTWRTRLVHDVRAIKVLGYEITIMHFTARNAAGTTHTTFTRDACSG
jgi:hypothetical protein